MLEIQTNKKDRQIYMVVLLLLFVCICRSICAAILLNFNETIILIFFPQLITPANSVSWNCQEGDFLNPSDKEKIHVATVEGKVLFLPFLFLRASFPSSANEIEILSHINHSFVFVIGEKYPLGRACCTQYSC